MNDNIAIYKKRIRFLIFAGLSPLVGFSPFIIGGLGSLLTPNCTNEANCGWAALPWLMFATVPAGFVLFLLGLVRFLISLKDRLTKSEDSSFEEFRLRIYMWAWLVAAFSPNLVPIAFIFAAPGNGQYALLISGAVLYAASLLFIGVMAIIQKVRK